MWNFKARIRYSSLSYLFGVHFGKWGRKQQEMQCSYQVSRVSTESVHPAVQIFVFNSLDVTARERCKAQFVQKVHSATKTKLRVRSANN